MNDEEKTTPTELEQSEREKLKQELLKEIRQEEEERKRTVYTDKLPEREVLHTQTIIKEKRGMGGCLKAFLIFIAIILAYSIVTSVLDPDKKATQSPTTSKVTTASKETVKPTGTVTKFELPASYSGLVKLDEGESKQLLMYYTSTGKVSGSDFKITSSSSSVVNVTIIEATDTEVKYLIKAKNPGIATVWLSCNGVTSDSITVNVGNVDVTTAPPNNNNTERLTYDILDMYYSVVKHKYMDDLYMDIHIIVENTGTVDLYLQSATLDIEDENGNLVMTRSSVGAIPFIIKPGETAVYQETFSDPLIKQDTNYKIVPNMHLYRSRLECIRYDISNVSVSTGSYGEPRIIGRVTNTSDETPNIYYVYALLFDKNGKCIGIGSDMPSDISPGETIGFDIDSWTECADIYPSDVASYEIYAFPFQYQHNG